MVQTYCSAWWEMTCVICNCFSFFALYFVSFSCPLPSLLYFSFFLPIFCSFLHLRLFSFLFLNYGARRLKQKLFNLVLWRCPVWISTRTTTRLRGSVLSFIPSTQMKSSCLHWTMATSFRNFSNSLFTTTYVTEPDLQPVSLNIPWTSKQ
jgi:hypothetical protein